MSPFDQRSLVKTATNSAEILEIQETEEETIEEMILAEITVVSEENNVPRLTTTIGPAVSAIIPISHSAKHAIAVKHPALVEGEVLEIMEGVQTVDHNEIVDDLTVAAVMAVKKFTTITIGPAVSATTRILHSVKYAIVVKHPALVVEEEVVLEVAVMETEEAVAVAEMVAVAMAEVAVMETEEVVAVAEMVAAPMAEVVVMETEEAVAVAEMVTDAVVAETEVIQVAEVVIIVEGEVAIRVIVVQKASVLGMLITENQTTSNQRSTTDTTID